MIDCSSSTHTERKILGGSSSSVSWFSCMSEYPCASSHPSLIEEQPRETICQQTREERSGAVEARDNSGAAQRNEDNNNPLSEKGLNNLFEISISSKNPSPERRDTTVILSSDDEDDDCDYKPSLNRSYTKKSKSRPFITRTNPRQPKKPRVLGSRSRFSRESTNLFEVGFPNEDFEELFSGSKVEEVKLWFEERLKTPKENLRNHVLVITGQAGVGKSTTIHVIASHFGARLCEWNTPTPTIWQEHVHNANTGIQYTSKLDEFVNFTEKIRKYGLIPSSFAKDSKQSIILLIDDLPVTNGRDAFERLKSCLLHLVRSTQIPTAILVTDYSKADSTDHTARSLEQLQLSLENAGACKVSFNPITNNSIKRTLSSICRQEQHSVTDEQLDLIAKASGGDIRHAITSLQLFCVKPDLALNGSHSTPSYSYRKEDDINALVSGISLLFGRDETLSLFHALGKFLHNKRETEDAKAIMTGVSS
ncbi:unnamed protein product [Dovyalis caffra]|uniref:Cell cycle checkpoint protein RAD17 n=1 Tax=Dovyalis caffra TaxID=77055 RepID=A0AAV1RG27_9ROSI|nr:unnamed protein product [Dovyalis caffra]